MHWCKDWRRMDLGQRPSRSGLMNSVSAAERNTKKTGSLISNCLNLTFFYLLWGLLGYSKSSKYLNCICFTSFIAEVVRIKKNSLFSFVINTSSAIEHDYFVMNLFCFALHWLKVRVSKSFFTEFPRARIFPCWVTVLALFTVTFYFLFKVFEYSRF